MWKVQVQTENLLLVWDCESTNVYRILAIYPPLMIGAATPLPESYGGTRIFILTPWPFQIFDHAGCPEVTGVQPIAWPASPERQSSAGSLIWICLLCLFCAIPIQSNSVWSRDARNQIWLGNGILLHWVSSDISSLDSLLGLDPEGSYSSPRSSEDCWMCSLQYRWGQVSIQLQ